MQAVNPAPPNPPPAPDGFAAGEGQSWAARLKELRPGSSAGMRLFEHRRSSGFRNAETNQRFETNRYKRRILP
jgi:hypothetical protein